MLFALPDFPCRRNMGKVDPEGIEITCKRDKSIDIFNKKFMENAKNHLTIDKN
jgi:hypothetical protein